MTGPAFILGNGPTLPADLSCLARQFTVGVNRILASGFCPTVLMWVDHEIWREHGQQIDASEALLVTPRPQTQRHIGLRLWAGDDCWKRPATPASVNVCGNTGVGAARWAYALGCRPIYLLGMSGEYDGDRTDFYGRNERHGADTRNVLSRELAALRDQLGPAVIPLKTLAGVRLGAYAAADRDQAQLRRLVREEISRHG